MRPRIRVRIKTPKDFIPLEKDIQRDILTYLKTRKDIVVWPNKSVGIYDPVRKRFRKPVDPFHRNGVSDILGFFKGTGRILVIEVKRPKKSVVSKDQQEFLDDVNAGGGLGFVARSVEDVKKAIP